MDQQPHSRRHEQMVHNTSISSSCNNSTRRQQRRSFNTTRTSGITTTTFRSTRFIDALLFVVVTLIVCVVNIRLQQVNSFTTIPTITFYHRPNYFTKPTTTQTMNMARSSFEAIPDNDDDDEEDDNLKSSSDENNNTTPPSVGLPVGKVAGITYSTSSSGMDVAPIPTGASGMGFGSSQKRSYVAIGTPPVNDINKPEYDKDGYMLYTDEQTGDKSRVFEALVEYPSVFKIKIVGKNEGTFVEDIVAMVKQTCEGDNQEYVKEASSMQYSTKVNGKWISVTVEAPVQNAQMLYELYETIDEDSRVRFKF